MRAFLKRNLVGLATLVDSKQAQFMSIRRCAQITGNVFCVIGAALLAILLVFLLSIGSRAFKFIIPFVALTAFAVQYADSATWDGILKPMMALLPLGIALFGIYIIFRGAFRSGGP